MKNFAKKHAQVFLKYALVGIVGTIIDVGLFTLLVAATPLGDSLVGKVAAASISFVVAVLNNYLLNSAWTFERSVKNKKQFSRFVTVSIGGWLLNITFLALFVWLLHSALVSAALVLWSDPLPTWSSTLAKIGASITVLIYNFLANRFWTFKA